MGVLDRAGQAIGAKGVVERGNIGNGCTAYRQCI